MGDSHEISREEVLHMARLSRLKVNERELEMFRVQFARILGHMDMLARVDTEGVEPLYSPVCRQAHNRPDKADNRRTREEILSNAPDTDGEYFIVPRIV